MSREGIHLRGNQREGSPHYVYLKEDNYDENILLNIKPISRFRKIEVINIEVKPSDTLQALALRYGCTISALKQINKIDKDNEIYAKPSIKVPVKPFSVLTERQEYDDNESIQDSKEESEEEELSSRPTSMNAQSSGSEINTIILNSVCTPLLIHNNSIKISNTENNSLPNNKRTGVMKDIFNCSGDDCGLSWRQLFICALLVVFVIPIIYIYIYIIKAFGHTLKTNETADD